MTVYQSSLSKEYVRVPVVAYENGELVDPTTDPVFMAFMADPPKEEPANGDWKTAAWEYDGITYFARCLVGPGGTVELEDGTYHVWVKLTDSPEVPVRRVGRLVIS